MGKNISAHSLKDKTFGYEPKDLSVQIVLGVPYYSEDWGVAMLLIVQNAMPHGFVPSKKQCNLFINGDIGSNYEK